MASNKVLAFAALLLVLLPIAAKGDNSPALSPLYEKICDKVQCGKGTCEADLSYPFGYICKCDAGWTRTTDDNINDNLEFLPCVIPNCTLKYSGCQPAPPPVPQKPVPYNTSFFDPCYWIYCGEGTCNKTEAEYHRVCECKAGYSNLLNETYFPCYSECTLGSDCSRLGITVAKQQSTPAGGSGKASTFMPGKLQWGAVLIISMALALWK